MTAMPPESIEPSLAAGRTLSGRGVSAAGDEAPLAAQWLTLHEVAAVVGALSGLGNEGVAARVQGFPAAIASLAGNVKR